MYVVATAGHVDHGKSTLVRALTGIEPDRWAEERRRGLTIDLGFAWTTLGSGREVAFVDVPGHERFLGNMLAGLGPAPVVCFVVAADEGWRAQSSDHRDVVAALGVGHGLLVISRTDLAPQRVDDVVAEARDELADTGLRDAPAVAVSAVEGSGLARFRAVLDDVLAGVPPASAEVRVRLWVDRSFSITGAGTVVTGTLTGGTITRGDQLELIHDRVPWPTGVRGLQTRGEPVESIGPVSRVAVNLRGVSVSDVRRGDVLVTPGAWHATDLVDVRRATGAAYVEVPEYLVAHVGTTATSARLRPFDAEHCRLRFERRLPLEVGDRIVLLDPGGRRVLGGCQVLDADPPELGRRGDGGRRGAALASMSVAGDVRAEVARRGAVSAEFLRTLGLPAHRPPDGVREIDGWWVDDEVYADWVRQLRGATREQEEQDPLAGGLTRGAVIDLLGLPDTALLEAVVRDAGLVQHGGRIGTPGRQAIEPAESAVATLEARLRDAPFSAPEAGDLVALGLGPRELAAAARTGRLLRLRDGVVLLPSAPDLAVRELTRLPQPFTTSQARQALATTRRVAVPLLEYLDALGLTRRLDAGHRAVVPGSE